jgi:hypothetical protein
MWRWLELLLAFLNPRIAGGGGGDGGAGEMRQQEAERQRKVQAAVDAINVKFGAGSTLQRPTMADVMPAQRGGFIGGLLDNTVGPVAGQAALPGAIEQFDANVAEAERNRILRDTQYADIGEAVRATAMRDVDRQYSKASHANTYGLARAGLLGGSADAESGGELQGLYGEGRLKATQSGQQATSDLRMTDEKTRQSLIGLAQSGLDTGSAASMAAGQMQSAAELARAQAGGATVGRLFDDLSQAYVAQQVGKARAGAAQGQQQPTGYSYGGFGPNRYTGTVGR